jgi:hypothetical protein
VPTNVILDPTTIVTAFFSGLLTHFIDLEPFRLARVKLVAGNTTARSHVRQDGTESMGPLQATVSEVANKPEKGRTGF